MKAYTSAIAGQTGEVHVTVKNLMFASRDQCRSFESDLWTKHKSNPRNLLDVFFYNIKYFWVPKICIWTTSQRVDYKSLPKERNW